MATVVCAWCGHRHELHVGRDVVGFVFRFAQSRARARKHRAVLSTRWLEEWDGDLAARGWPSESVGWVGVYSRRRSHLSSGGRSRGSQLLKLCSSLATSIAVVSRGLISLWRLHRTWRRDT